MVLPNAVKLKLLIYVYMYGTNRPTTGLTHMVTTGLPQHALVLIISYQCPPKIHPTWKISHQNSYQPYPKMCMV